MSEVSLVDAGSFAAHKFYGPKGTGFLFLRSGLPIQPLMFGGAHENQRRPGTENVAGVAGMAAAAEWVLRDADAERQRQAQLRDDFWTRIAKLFPDAQQNGDQLIGSPIRSTQVLSALIRKRCSWHWIWKAFARRAVRHAWLAR